MTYKKEIESPKMSDYKEDFEQINNAFNSSKPSTINYDKLNSLTAKELKELISIFYNY